jgi:hypothetical protein
VRYPNVRLRRLADKAIRVVAGAAIATAGRPAA